jgi:integrase/recombinase XerD
MLSLYRRHLHKCPHRSKGQSYTKCSCPIWCDGELNGKRRRESLKTRDWQRAIRRLAALEDPKAPQVKPVKEAMSAFQNHILSLESSTQRKYRNVLANLRAYCEQAHIEDLAELSIEHLDAYRAGRKLSPVTSLKELQTLRQFFSFCFERKWIGENPAKAIKTPRNIKPTDVIPFAPEETARIISACDVIGRTPYERLRARAMVLLLDNTALRISDIATLSRDRVRAGRIVLRTLKTGQVVSLPIWPLTQMALDALPAPRGGGDSPRCYFWNGTTSKRAVVGIAERTLAAVFKKSGVPGAHAHRFRHTLATRLLGAGATETEVADILGNSPAIVRKHYGKWSQARQERIDRLMQAPIFGTSVVHAEKGPVIH